MVAAPVVRPSSSDPSAAPIPTSRASGRKKRAPPEVSFDVWIRPSVVGLTDFAATDADPVPPVDPSDDVSDEPVSEETRPPLSLDPKEPDESVEVDESDELVVEMAGGWRMLLTAVSASRRSAPGSGT